MRPVIAALLAVVFWSWAALPVAAETRVALVIGNADYKLISALKNPQNDAKLMIGTLRQLGFDVVDAQNANRSQMVRAMREFGRRLAAGGADAVGLFYYAGHGIQALNTNFLVPLDAPITTEADLELEAVDTRWVLRQMERAGNKLNIIVLDACRNNPLKGPFRSAARGLTRINAPSGSLIAYSAAPGQVALDGTGENSPYTAALARAMTQPGQELIRVFRLARIEVESRTGGTQTPWEEQSLTRDFYFVPDTAEPVVPLIDTNTEALFWASVKDSENVAVYEEFLRRFPNGTFAGLAKLRIAALKEKLAALPPPQTPTGEVKVGSVAGLTGPIAELVQPIMAARDLAASHVNAQGGLLNGGTLKLVHADSSCDPKAGITAGQSLVRRGVIAIIGPNCSGATNGMVRSVTIPAGLVSISDSATSPSIREIADNDLVYRVAASDDLQGSVLAQLTWDRGHRKVAITAANDDYNTSLAAAFRKTFSRLGGTIVADKSHEPDRTSHRALLTQLSGRGAQTLAIFAYYGSGGINIIRESLKGRMFTTFVGSDGMFDQSVIDEIGAHKLRGKILLAQASTDYEAASYRRFADAFRSVGEDPLAPYVTHGYDASFLVALAIEKAGSVDRTKISAALRSVASAPGIVILPGEWRKAKQAIAQGQDINYEGAAGSHDFDAAGDVPGTFAVLTVSANGRWTSELIR